MLVSNWYQQDNNTINIISAQSSNLSSEPELYLEPKHISAVSAISFLQSISKDGTSFLLSKLQTIVVCILSPAGYFLHVERYTNSAHSQKNIIQNNTTQEMRCQLSDNSSIVSLNKDFFKCHRSVCVLKNVAKGLFFVNVLIISHYKYMTHTYI